MSDFQLNIPNDGIDLAQMVTLKDIARKAALSVYTVSDILNCGDQRYRESTRRRVRQIAERAGYRPHRQAQMTRTGRSRTIGFIVHASLLQTAYERAYHVSRYIRSAGYQVMIHDTLLAEGSGAAAVSAMVENRVEGVILASYTEDFGRDEIEALRRARIPLVTLRTAHYPGIPLVTCDCRQGVRDLTRHMLERGYRHLAFFTPGYDPRNWLSSERVNGFGDAIRAAGGKIVETDLSEEDAGAAREKPKRGRPLTGEVMVYPVTASSLNPFTVGQQAMRRLLQRPSRPRAVLCQNDDWAVGAAAACAEAGVRIPQDLAITGFDNTFVGATLVPRLTTVAQPIETMAQKTVELLFKLIHGTKIPPREELVQIPCELLIRESCGNRTG